MSFCYSSIPPLLTSFSHASLHLMANKKSPLPCDYRYRLPPGGNKKPPSVLPYLRIHWICSFMIADRSMKAKTGCFGSINHPLDPSVIYRWPLERSLSLYGHVRIFPLYSLSLSFRFCFSVNTVRFLLDPFKGSIDDWPCPTGDPLVPL